MYSNLILISLFITLGQCAVEFSERSRNFSIVLLHHTAVDTDWHVVISPFGIWTLMTGLALGASGNSYDEIKAAFILPSDNRVLLQGYKNLTDIVLAKRTPEVSLSSSNYVFLDKGFSINPNFRQAMSDDFKASLKILDFKDSNLAAKTANSYIGNSGGRVTNVLTSDDFRESRMILTNVISFKGLWGLPFNKTDTNTESFYSENGKRVLGEVNMMYQRNQFPFSNMKVLKAHVMELPYGNDGRYSMLILLPYINTKVTTVYKSLATISFSDIYNQLKADEEEYGLEDIDVKVPRFKISTNVVLNMPLNKMGVYDIFEESRADFSKVSNEQLFVSAIVHKADIEMTESGTVASAATSAAFADRITPPKFYANRPFIYFVMEKSTMTVIFGGIYSKPTVF